MVLTSISILCQSGVYADRSIGFAAPDKLDNRLLSVSKKQIPGEPEGKWRILVDKVLMKSNNWVMTKDHVKEIKDAGFNVLSPRVGGTDFDRVRKIAGYAHEVGIKYVAWMRGSLSSKLSDQYTHPDGLTQPIYSPNSNQLWNSLRMNIIRHAKLSLQVPSIIGSFIDFENYAKGKKDRGNLYDISIDQKIISEFSSSIEKKIPHLAPDKRKKWLESNNIWNTFIQYQIKSWRKKAKQLKIELDKINPNYFLIIYPSTNTRFINQALIPEWSKGNAPLVLADASTYGRGSSLMPTRLALFSNKKKLKDNIQTVAEHINNIRYLGGIDPLAAGADPEFSSRNANMISDHVDGYWVFYEGVEYSGKHSEYFKWFKNTNSELDKRYLH